MLLLLGFVWLSAVEQASNKLSCKATEASTRTATAMASTPTPTSPTTMRTLPSKERARKASEARLFLGLMLPTRYGIHRKILLLNPHVSNRSRTLLRSTNPK